MVSKTGNTKPSFTCYKCPFISDTKRKQDIAMSDQGEESWFKSKKGNFPGPIRRSLKFGKRVANTFVFNLHGVATCKIVRKCAQYCKTCGKMDFVLLFCCKNEPLVIRTPSSCLFRREVAPL
jgi:hypothetical protein